MNNQEFMEKLKRLIRKLPHDEYIEAINYYEQFFADGGKIKETPEQVASNIMADYCVKKPNLNAIWILLSFPISIPLAIAALAIVFAGYAVMLALFAAAFGIIFAGVGSIIGGVAIITQHLPTTLFFTGTGCLEIVGGLFAFKGCKKLFSLTNKGISTLLSKMIRRVGK